VKKSGDLLKSILAIKRGDRVRLQYLPYGVCI